jgi:hypothetical protein
MMSIDENICRGVVHHGQEYSEHIGAPSLIFVRYDFLIGDKCSKDRYPWPIDKVWIPSGKGKTRRCDYQVQAELDRQGESDR